MLRLVTFAGAAMLALTACSKETGQQPESTDRPTLTTYKSANCGCCKQWVKHARDNGFAVTANDSDDLNGIKKQHDIDPRHQSCHTSVSAGGYVFEGHIPARLIRQFLQNPPDGARGLAVAAMPVGSPGMEMGDRFDPYRVWQLNNNGSRTLYAEIETAAAQF
ncbi:DUF411 domain-containing protein [Microbulbifer halophilus]|uniref:DUF411 domain-containing protein n=1 Tax=Microbulbifer halophilus TaxID=453963 RepID=A0ABW5EDZ4_9GAMM|nr:DUF411 domain-containing protein [Microbulbifer halophilus]MCW8127689.1 DUF411 domain-containing protein [Microbulbifer halophilus]